MEFMGSNLLAVLAAAVAAFAVGAVWYGVLSKQWLAAVELSEEEAQMKPSLFVTTFVCELVMAFVLSGLVHFAGQANISIRTGIITAILVWVGFVMPAMIVNHSYGKRSRDLTVIDGGHWLLVLLVMGIVIGWFG